MLIVLTYVAATVILAGPLVNFRHLGSAIYGGDAQLILWTLAWDSHAILNGLPLFQANIFYPAPDALAYNEHLIGLALFFLPIYALTQKPVLAYNLLWLASWLLNALAGHALARRYVRDDLAAAVGALIFAFSFFRMLHGHGHLSLAWTFWIPLSLLALEQWYRRPGWLRAAWLTLTVVMQVLTNWYLGVLALLANSVFLLCLVTLERGSAEQVDATAGRKLTAARLIQGLASVGALFAAIWPFARHYRGLGTATTAEAARFSADALAYLMPPQNTWMGRALSSAGVAGPRWIWGESTMYLGAVALAFAAIGLAALWSSRRRQFLPAFPRHAAVFFPLIGLLALVLSFGPVAAHVPTSWMPFTWLTRVPGLGGLRSPARFGLLVVLAMSVVAAAGAAWLHRRLPVRGRLVTLLLVPLMLSEWYVVDFPGGKPRPAPIPKVYRYLADVPARAIVSLPIRTANWAREADYLYYSTAHWHPIINGFGRAAPPDSRWIAGHMAAFAGSNSARTMRRLGVDYVVLHADRLPEGSGMLEEALQNTADFFLAARDGQDYLFKVRPAGLDGASKR